MARFGWLLVVLMSVIGPLTAGDDAGSLTPAAREAHKRSSDRGIKWILKAQNRDGSWGMDHQTPADVGCTAMVGLSLLSSGYTEREGPNRECATALKKSVDYLLAQVRKMRAGGDIMEGQHTQIHNYVGQRAHNFMAAMFLSQVSGMRSAEFSPESYVEMKAAVEKLSEGIATGQDSDGSWHKETYSSLQATAMAFMALRSSASTGVDVRNAAIDKTIRFIKREYNSGSRMYDGGRGGNGVYASCAAVRILYGSGMASDPGAKAAVDTLLKTLVHGGYRQHFMTNVGEDFPAAVMLTHALSQEGGTRFDTWFKFVTERLQKTQNGDGSWTTTSCLVGRTFATACAVLCFETPERLLPLQDL